MAYVAVHSKGDRTYLALGLSVEEIEAFTSRPFRKNLRWGRRRPRCARPRCRRR
jgi:hypothetical protein